MKFKVVSKTGWLLLLILTVVPIVIWFTMSPLHDRFSTPYQTLSNLGRLIGIASMVFFSLNIILTARLRFIETLFGGLNKVYIAHHIIGGLALLVILAHPLLFALRAMTISPRDAAMQLIPFMNDTMTTIGILALWLFIALMILTLYVKLPYKTWLLTHKFMGLVMLGIVIHIVLGANDINNSVWLQGYSWGMLALASVAFLYRTLLPRVFVRRYTYTITGVQSLSEGVVRIVMMPEKRAIHFRPGQFVFLRFDSEGFSHEWHPFSISSNTRQEGLAVTVKSLGEYTTALVKFAPGMVGMKMMIEGAYGRFSFKNFPKRRQIWIAGGIGVTPFLSMIPDVAAPYSVDFYYSVKSSSELIDNEYIQSVVAASGGSVRALTWVADDYGYLTGDKIRELSGELGDVDFLLCGPPPMMYALKEQLKSQGVRASRIHSEEFAMS